MRRLFASKQTQGKSKMGLISGQAILRGSFLIFFLASCAGAITDRGGHSRVIRMAPAATIIRSQDYTILGKAQGESSTLFLLGLFPVTNALNMQYAMSQAIQSYPGGQSMTDMVYWHETHYYYPIGTVSVVKVEGTVVGLKREEADAKKTGSPSPKQTPPQRKSP